MCTYRIVKPVVSVAALPDAHQRVEEPSDSFTLVHTLPVWAFCTDEKAQLRSRACPHSARDDRRLSPARHHDDQGCLGSDDLALDHKVGLLAEWTDNVRKGSGAARLVRVARRRLSTALPRHQRDRPDNGRDVIGRMEQDGSAESKHNSRVPPKPCANDQRHGRQDR